MEYDYGWRELERQGADLVVWPSASPQTGMPAARARRYGYYIVSSPPRNNASVFEPTGKITAQIRPPESVLVQEIDLSYAILPWSEALQNGAALKAKYGDKVGFRYYEDEDHGIFWSNDPQVSIGKMVRESGFAEAARNWSASQTVPRRGRSGVPVKSERRYSTTAGRDRSITSGMWSSRIKRDASETQVPDVQEAS